jgi:hypothetical protein
LLSLKPEESPPALRRLGHVVATVFANFILDVKVECIQYFPKGTDLSVYSKAHINKAVHQLNERPREDLKPQQKDLMQVLRRPVETTVISGHHEAFGPSPPHPRKRTSRGVISMSAKCQWRTLMMSPRGTEPIS